MVIIARAVKRISINDQSVIDETTNSCAHSGNVMEHMAGDTCHEGTSNMMRFLFVVVAGLSIFSAPALADGLNDEDTVWLIKTVGSMWVDDKCDAQNVKFDFAGARLWGDQNGADVSHLSLALAATFASYVKQPYNHDDIDPRVTRLYLKAMEGFDELTHREGKPAICKKFADLGLRDGFLKKSDK